MTQNEKLNIAIIGADVAGMSAAWDLVRAGHSVTIYEATDRVGGLAAGFKDDKWDWTLEKFYHHWFEGDSDMLFLIDDIGQSENVIFKRPKTSFWMNGDIVRSEIEPISVLKLPMTLRGKVKFMLGGAFLKLTPFWKMLEGYTADEWMKEWMGEEGYNRFFRTLLIGKFGEDYDKVNAAWIWARVKARSLKLGTFRGGFQAFLDALADTLKQHGVTICTNTPVEKIELDGLQPTITVNGETARVDFVISTTSPKIMLKLAPRLVDTAYGDKMADLKSIGGLCVVYALKHKLMNDDTYWLNLPAVSPDYHDNEFPYLALVEHTNFMDKEHYGGDHIIYCGDYVAPDHDYFQMSEVDLAEHFMSSMKKVNPDFDRDWVRKWWVFRAPYAQPIPTRYHSENLPPLQTPMPNVIWASMSQVYPWDRGTNFSVRMGRRVARIVMGQESNTSAIE
ncbi:MAG: NAD(P)/FAD-dependent oxidoreductase [Anaerolineae bacterium]|nr:NAD(P)/FAD-dependent oxidoreductase [Anaerolineae bacterium]